MMLSGKGLAMVASLFGLISLWLPSPSFASPSVKVTGVLKGYFLSPDGTLKVREIPFAFPERPAAPDLPERLFPLPAGYYLQGKFSASEPIQSVWLLSGNGRLLWRRHYPEGVLEEDMPYQAGGWIGLRGEDGLSVRLLVRFVDGRETVIRLHFPVRFERVLPLKVDWLDFVRIAEVAHLLKEKGKEIWEGFSLDGIPFLLEGAEGQWVLINHPKPPKGFKRYEGPLPKVPFPMTVYVGEKSESNEGRNEPDGWIERVNGVWTAILRYYPTWWVLSECALFGYERPREPDPLARLEVILHEAFHVWWFQRMKELDTRRRSINPEEVMTKILAERVERMCLAYALSEGDTNKQRQWAKAFLKERQERRNLEGANKDQIIFERWLETVEGIATFVSWQALELAEASDYQPLAALEGDYEFNGYRAPGEERLLASVMGKDTWLGLEKPHALGLAQVKLLSKWQVRWKEQILHGRSLEELLDETLKDVKVPEDLVESLKQKLKEELEEILKERQARLMKRKPPERIVVIWVYLPEEVISVIERIKKTVKELIPNFRLELSNFSLQVKEPFSIIVEKGKFGILWDQNKPLQVYYEKEGITKLHSDGLEVVGKIQVYWDASGVHVHPVEKSQKIGGGAAKMLGKKAHLLLPLVLLGANFTDCSSLTAQIDISGVMVGTFYDNQTQQFVYLALPVPCEPVDDYRLVDEEEYWLYLTIQGMEDTSSLWTDDTIVTLYVTYQFDHTGESGFKFITRVEQPPTQGSIVKVEYDGEWLIIVYRDKNGNEYVVRIRLKHPPKTGSLVAFGEVYDYGKYVESIPVRVSVYGRDKHGNVVLKGSGDGRYGKDGFPEPAIVIVPVGSNYWAIGEPIGRGDICPKVRRDNIIIHENAPTTITFDFFVHKGIKGKVRVETPWMPASVPKVATILLAREAKQNEPADFTITNPDGTVTRYKKIAETVADKNIRMGDNWVEAEFLLEYPQPEKPDGQTYELFAFLDGPFPIPSNYRWEPKFGWSTVFVPPCKRGEGGQCEQRQTKDIGLVVTFRPVKGGDDGIESPINF
jgi:hypothetical protein